MDEKELNILFIKRSVTIYNKDERKTYLKKVVDARTFKLLHLHVIALVHLTVSDDSFKHPPRIVLVQN